MSSGVALALRMSSNAEHSFLCESGSRGRPLNFLWPYCQCPSGFLPLALNFDISVSLVLDELLGPPYEDIGLPEGSEGSHDA